jgi:hypothetical protein
MDVASSIGAVFAAVGLSAAAGLNAYLPLLMGAVLERADVVELGDPFGALSSDGGIAVLAALLIADLVGDKTPGVDHVLHLAGVVIAPVAGAILFVGQTGIETGIPAAVAAILGAATAETLHGARASVRPASTASTAGLGNPVLSLGEDAAALTLTILAFALPVLAVLLALALLAGVVSAAGRLRPRRR